MSQLHSMPGLEPRSPLSHSAVQTTDAREETGTNGVQRGAGEVALPSVDGDAESGRRRRGERAGRTNRGEPLGWGAGVAGSASGAQQSKPASRWARLASC